VPVEEFSAIGGWPVWGLGVATGERDAEDWGWCWARETQGT
jgi:hypothetical protein